MIHDVRNSGKRLEVAALDLSGSLGEILDRINELADRIRGLRRSRSASINSENGVPVFRVPANASPITSDDVYAGAQRLAVIARLTPYPASRLTASSSISTPRPGPSGTAR